MPKKPDFDLAAAHKYFAANCFNETWGIIDKADRTPEDDQMMIQTCQASLYHWSQREDITDQNRSVGYWQAARVYALVGQADIARQYGQWSLDSAKNEPPFYSGYAYEALARAEMAAGNKEAMADYLAKAKEQAAKVTDAESKKWLEKDLATIG